MASNLRIYPDAEDVVIPWNADYEFPSVANKAIKISPRLPASTGSSPVLPGQTVSFTFPAQGYLDGKKTTVSFDLYLKGYDTYNFGGTGTKPNTGSKVYLQNNISSIFKHARLSYGSYQLEQVQENGFLQRQLSEMSGYGANDNDQLGIAKGVSGISSGPSPGIATFDNVTLNNRARTHSLINDVNTVLTTAVARIRPTYVSDGAHYAVKRYQVELPFGLLQQGKLLPVKYMAGQLQLDLTLCSAEEIILANGNIGSHATPNNTGTPSFYLKNVALHPETLEFDQFYDAKVLKGLESGGIPIQYSSFKSYISVLNSSNMQIAIPEKSRSVKAIFAFVRQQQNSFQTDNGASFGDFEGSILSSYQVRVGNRYFPAAPCINTHVPGKRTGSAEPFVELQKALKVFGDPSIIAAINPQRWNAVSKTFTIANNTAGFPTNHAAADGSVFAVGVTTDGLPDSPIGLAPYEVAAGELSGVFCMAMSLETSNGRELSGLNAEEQSDISLNIQWSAPPPAGYEIVVYTLTDKVMVVKENNQVVTSE